MSEYKEIVVGSDALRYVAEQLAGGRSLSREIASLLDISAGTVRTFVPVQVQEITHYHLIEGGFMDRHKNMDWLIDAIRGFLATGEGTGCVWEDPEMESHDPCVASCTFPLMFFGDDVYHLLAGYQSDRNKIESAIREATSSWRSLGVMTTVPTDLGGKVLSCENLRALAVNAQKIVLGAFDGEGYLIWEK